MVFTRRSRFGPSGYTLGATESRKVHVRDRHVKMYTEEPWTSTRKSTVRTELRLRYQVTRSILCTAACVWYLSGVDVQRRIWAVAMVYALTGAGKKDRAHPLAVSVALTQLEQLADCHRFKTKYAEKMIQGLAGIPFLRMPHTNSSSSSAWYAMILQVDAQTAPEGMNRDNFVAKLHEAGLQDIDIPKSTGLLYGEHESSMEGLRQALTTEI